MTGTVFSLAFETRLHGPCYRCLGDAVLDVPIDAREYQASEPDDEELTTPYVVDDVLEVSAWARRRRARPAEQDPCRTAPASAPTAART